MEKSVDRKKQQVSMVKSIISANTLKTIRGKKNSV